jgi:hypothetical protein
MIKKLLFAFLIISYFSVQNLNAQCTPVPFPPPPLTNPDTTQGIPPAFSGVPYNETIHVRVPADTVVFGTLLPIDSIGVDSITGLPPTFTWATNTPSNYWLGGTYGCFAVSGNPTIADTGTYQMVLHAKIFVGHNANNTILYDANFEFKILDSALMSMENISGKSFEIQTIPNPFDQKTSIRFKSPVNDVFTFEVYNVSGKIMRKEQVEVRKGLNSFEFSKEDLPSGMYIYRLYNDDYQVHRQMIIR